MSTEFTDRVKSTGIWSYGLTAPQVAVIAAAGVGFWYLGATVVSLGSAWGIFGPLASIATFAVNVPATWLAVVLIVTLARLRPEQIVPGISLGLAIATLLDGMALTWMPRLYGSDPTQLTLGAATILWGAGCFIGTAFFEAWRRAKSVSGKQ